VALEDFITASRKYFTPSQGAGDIP